MPSAYYAPRYEEYLQRLVGTFAVRAGLTDIADSSRARYLASAQARILEELGYATVQQRLCWNVDTASGADLDARALELSGNTLTRNPANAAQGAVVLYANQPGATLTIPAGVTVATDGRVEFRTTAVATITPTNPAQLPGHITGQDSGLVPVVAVIPGASGNQAAGSITTLSQRPTGVDGVGSITPTQFGRDIESDDSLRARIRAYASSLARSTPSAIVGAVLGAQDASTGATIADAKLVESETTPGSSTLYIDDGFGEAATTEYVTGELLTQGLPGLGGTAAAGGETQLSLARLPIDTQVPPKLTSDQRGNLLVNTDFTYDPLNGRVSLTSPLSAGESITADYTCFTGLVALAQKIVDGSDDDPIAFPGYRAAGTRVTVTVPQIVSVNVQAILSVDGAYNAQQVHDTAQGVVVAYINTLRIGQAVQASSIISQLMATTGVVNVTLIQPSADVIVGQGQLARTDASRVQVA